jgi:hypothetical protein
MLAAEPGSLHDRYRERLAALETDVAPVAAIDEAGRRNGWWSPGRPWVRWYGRFDPDQEPFVSMVFKIDEEPQLICHVEVFTTRPASAEDCNTWVAEQADGWLRVTRFPSDPALPTLASVLSRPGGRRTVVRYRAHSRCSIRFEAPDGRVEFAKVFRDQAGERCHANSQLLWQDECREGLAFVVARPGRWEPEARTVWQEGIPGVPVTAQHLAAEGSSLAHRMGGAAASLTRSCVRPLVAYDLATHFGRSVRYGEDVSSRVPRLAPSVEHLMRELTWAQAAVRARPMRPIHGSLSRTQWIDGTSQLGLIDFDKLAYGDPEFDVAAFLTELDYDHLETDRIKHAFLSSYEAVAGPLDRRLLIIYGAHERLEKALKAVRAVRSDGDFKAESHLERALAECAELTT